MTDKFELSRRKALLGLGTIGLAGAGAGAGTSALFNDEETFENNSIQAGTTNLIVQAKVAALSDDLAASDGDVIIEATENEDGDPEVDGDAEIGITATDIKPGDSFVVGFNVIVEDNPMYVAAQANTLSDSENGIEEPEPDPGPDDNDDFITGGGDLDNTMETVIGYDSSPNDFTWDQGGAMAPANSEAGTGGGQQLTAYLDNLANLGFLYQDGEGVPEGHGGGVPTELGDGRSVTHWQYFEVPIGVGNEIQGDKISWNVTWYGEQVRNNPEPTGPTAVIDGSVNP